MKKFFYMAVAAITVLSSCSRNNEVFNSEAKKALIFTATMEEAEGARATFNATDKCAEWEEGDQISINGKTYSAQEAGTITTFEADAEGATGPTYNAYFPANLYNNGTPTLPANVSETWVDSQFNMPMYANSTTTELAFKNLCGVLKITVNSGQLASVKCITVSSTNCAISGAFTVTDNAAVLTDASITANTLTLTYTDAVTTDATGKVFYVAIPAQTYKNLSIAVSDGTTTKVMTTKADQDITVARNTIYPINFNGQPTTGKAFATDPSCDVNWVQLWAGGPKFAEYNVGAENKKAEDYGGLYCWGSSNDEKKKRTSGYSYYNDKGCRELSGNDDTATNLWGNNWRMPTYEEFENLINYCSETAETVAGCAGHRFTGKGAYGPNSIFLPDAGHIADLEKKSDGCLDYWSASNNKGRTAYDYEPDYLGCHYQNPVKLELGAVHYAKSVRAVLAEAK